MVDYQCFHTGHDDVSVRLLDVDLLIEPGRVNSLSALSSEIIEFTTRIPMKEEAD